MPTIQGRTSIGASSTVDNLLSGSPFEFLPFDAFVEVALTIDTGSAIGDVLADVYSGSDILALGMQVPNNGPINVDRDMYLEDQAAAGERLVVRARNTNAAARSINYLLKITPL